MSDPKSASLFERAERVIPGGVNSPVRAFRSVGGKPVFVARAEGAYLFGADGTRYTDYVGSWGPMILGHAHPAVVAAITEAARAKPGDVQYGTAGISTPMHLSTERYAILNKIKLTHVPFRGTGPLVTDLLGGHVKLGMSSLTSVSQQLQAGKLKAYGLAAPDRALLAPNIPTFKELFFFDWECSEIF